MLEVVDVGHKMGSEMLGQSILDCWSVGHKMGPEMLGLKCSKL